MEKGGLDYVMLDRVANIIKDLIESDIEVGLVV
jgi:uridylate kinase